MAGTYQKRIVKVETGLCPAMERMMAKCKTCGAPVNLAPDGDPKYETPRRLPPKVKPLEWEYHPAGAIAAPPTGFAYIIDARMKGRVYSLKGFNPPREFASMDDAKAAAQADYEIRVLSALEGYSPRNPA